MEKIVPALLKKGDEVRIIAPSRGVKIIGKDVRALAEKRLNELGLKVSYAENAVDENWDELGTTSVQKRVDDIMNAFKDKNVKAIMTMIGGFNSNQILPYLDYEVIKGNPKILCGFSDITALLDAIYAKTCLITFSGPHFSSLGMLKGCDYTIKNMLKMLMEKGENEVAPSKEWSDDLWFIDQEKRDFIPNEGYWVLNDGQAKGTLLGGNLGTFNLLLGTSFRPKFEPNTILFVEDTAESSIFSFMRNLTALTYQDDFKNVKGVLIGRFQKGSKVSREQLAYIVKNVKPLSHLPVVANVDFGHSTPLLTLPVGGIAEINGANITLKIK